jgi:sugar/nucleoside kinase (ribokinase family)
LSSPVDGGSEAAVAHNDAEGIQVRRIAVAGHICLDITPGLTGNARLDPGLLVEVGPLSLALGGSVANTGRTLSALGANVVAFANVGDDALGEIVQQTLTTDDQIDGRLSVISGTSTSYSLVFEPQGSDRTFWHHVGANREFDGAEIELEGVDIFHLGYPPLLPALLRHDGAPLHHLLKRARTAGAITSVDLAVVDSASEAGAADWNAVLRTMAAQTDLVSPSLDDLTSALRIDAPFSIDLVEELADRLLGWGVAVVAISAGEHGLFIRTAGAARFDESGPALAALGPTWADRSVDIAPIRVDVPFTTNGAGDASTAGLLFALAVGATIDQAADLAAACSAAIVAGKSAAPSLVNGVSPNIVDLFPRALA